MPSEALPFSEAAREAAAFADFAAQHERSPRGREAAREGWSLVSDGVRFACHARTLPILAAAVKADPRAKACLDLAALTDDELVERVARAYRGYGHDYRTAGWRRTRAVEVLAALGLPVAEREVTG